MKKWIPIIASCVLVVVLVVIGVLYFQKSSDLKAAESDISTLKNTVSGLETSLTASKTQIADLTTKLITSQGEATALKGNVADLTTKLTASQGEATTLKGNVADLTTKLTASQGEATALRGNVTDLTTRNTKLDSDLKAANTQIAGLQSSLATTQSSLSTAQSSLSAAQTANTALTADLKKVKDPRHFESLSELADWLAKDDTNTKYASAGFLQRAFILQVRALRDGYLLPATASITSAAGPLYVGNVAAIGDKLYVISSTNDSVTAFWTISPLTSHPEPLP